jgi:hypothetical protein
MPELPLPSGECYPSRRKFIGGATLAIGLAAGLAGGLAPRRAAAAGSKLPPSDAGYQATPRGKARCEVCVNYQAPSACKVVDGPISPNGWCSLFAPKG